MSAQQRQQQVAQQGRDLICACVLPLDAGLPRARRMLKAGAPIDWVSPEGFEWPGTSPQNPWHVPAGAMPLITAATQGNLRVCELLLKKGALVDKAAPGGITALHAASNYGHRDIVRLLLSKGAHVNRADAVGSTALHWASKCGHTKVAEVLLGGGADVNPCANGCTPLYFACQVC